MSDKDGIISGPILKRIEELEGMGEYTEEQLADEYFIRRKRLDMDTYKEAKKAFETLANIVNKAGGDKIVQTALVGELVRTHRYLQAGLIHELVIGLGDLGGMYRENKARWSDGRNEHVMGLCERLRKAFQDDLFWKDKER